jgi:hypothetical protein
LFIEERRRFPEKKLWYQWRDSNPHSRERSGF